MPKRSAIIDLGSNSIRLVIFERTSRYGFFPLCEFKRKVRIGEGAYERGGALQPEACARAGDTLAFFKNQASRLGARKLILIGTSALRDAPNAKDFIRQIHKDLDLKIRIISGRDEGLLGGLGALRLLSEFKNATTLDIGGGSSELCLIRSGRIEDGLSLDIGTVRLKELFYDKGKINKVEDFLKPLIKAIPASFQSEKLIAIGGSLRAISNSIMLKNSYPLKSLHDFSYELEKERPHINKIINASPENLANYGIKKDRADTIRQGALIFLKIASRLGAKRIITSAAGIREGVFLENLLRPRGAAPVGFSPSLRSLQDRFCEGKKDKTAHFAQRIFSTLAPLHSLKNSHKASLLAAAKLCYAGQRLGGVRAGEHSAYLALHGLVYGYTHAQRATAATLLALGGKKPDPASPLRGLLPGEEALGWLNFILALARILAQNEDSADLVLEGSLLHIYSPHRLLELPQDEIKKLAKPKPLTLAINQRG